MLLVSLTVTALQLLVGGLLGGVVRWALRTMTLVVVPETETKTAPKSLIVAAAQPSPEELQLAMLHAVGSVATNLGFLYGSASLVQIVKLLGT